MVSERTNHAPSVWLSAVSILTLAVFPADVDGYSGGIGGRAVKENVRARPCRSGASKWAFQGSFKAFMYKTLNHALGSTGHAQVAQNMELTGTGSRAPLEGCLFPGRENPELQRTS